MQVLGTLKTTAGISARVFVVQFNGFMSLTIYFDVMCDVLHCFSLHPTESAGWIPVKQARDKQASSYWSMSSEDRYYHF